MKVVYAPRALRDIDEIIAYIQKRNRSAASNLSFAIEYTIHVCALNPRSGSKTDELNVYRWPLGKYRYTIFYRLRSENDGIEIARALKTCGKCQWASDRNQVT